MLPEFRSGSSSENGGPQNQSTQSCHVEWGIPSFAGSPMFRETSIWHLQNQLKPVLAHSSQVHSGKPSPNAIASQSDVAAPAFFGFCLCVRIQRRLSALVGIQNDTKAWPLMHTSKWPFLTINKLTSDYQPSSIIFHPKSSSMKHNDRVTQPCTQQGKHEIN